jgi:hypothetical protein
VQSGSRKCVVSEIGIGGEWDWNVVAWQG